MAVSLVAKYIYKSGYAWKDSLNNFSMRRYFVKYTLPVKLLYAIFEVDVLEYHVQTLVPKGL